MLQGVSENMLSLLQMRSLINKKPRLNAAQPYETNSFCLANIRGQVIILGKPQTLIT